MKYIKIYESFLLSKKTQTACDYIINKLNDELDPTLHYHNVEHTLQIMNNVKRLSEMEGLDEETSNLLYVAAAYHDSGFLIKYDNNEPEGVRIADLILGRFGFTRDEIIKIDTYIMAYQSQYLK